MSERRPRSSATPVEQQALEYDCTITLEGQDERHADRRGRVHVIGADMPSMPGAHNVHPVPAEPHGAPGMYRTRIELEMTGEWVLRLDFTRPSRDRLTSKHHFGAAKANGGHEH